MPALQGLKPIFLLSLVYRTGFLCWRQYLRVRRNKDNPPLPLLVVGSIRVGGAAKTPVSLSMALALRKRGVRVAWLGHATGTLSGGWPAFVDGSAEDCGDEAALAVRALGHGVYVTRDRWRAWNGLAELGKYDVLICDDGWEDPRLNGPRVRRIFLDWGEPGVSWRELLPSGSLRSLRRDSVPDHVWRCYGENPDVALVLSAARRALDGAELPGGPVVACCGIGDPQRWLGSLKRHGYVVQECRILQDHAPKLQFRRVVRDLLGQGLPVLMTRKDWVRLDGSLQTHGLVYVTDIACLVPEGFLSWPECQS